RSYRAALRARGPPGRPASSVVVTVPTLLPRQAAMAARGGTAPASARPIKSPVTAELLCSTAVRPRPAAAALRSLSSAAASHREAARSEEHTSELQSRENLVCRLLLAKKNN